MNLYDDRAQEKIATKIAVPQKSARRPNPLRPPLRLARRLRKLVLVVVRKFGILKFRQFGSRIQFLEVGR